MYITPLHLWEYYRKMEERGEPLEVAVAIGVHPAVFTAAATRIPREMDELEVAGGILGQPLEVTRCETVDIEVPANAEIVLEGRLLPNIRENDGPFGEFPNYYGPVRKAAVFQASAICTRSDPIYQTKIVGSGVGYEDGSPMREANIYKAVKEVVWEVKGVNCNSSVYTVIQIKKRCEGEAKRAILAALAVDEYMSCAVVVDDDVNIYDPEDVLWAIATRADPLKDIFVIPGVESFPLLPICEETPAGPLAAKMGVDATKPLVEAEKFQRSRLATDILGETKLEDYQ